MLESGGQSEQRPLTMMREKGCLDYILNATSINNTFESVRSGDRYGHVPYLSTKDIQRCHDCVRLPKLNVFRNLCDYSTDWKRWRTRACSNLPIYKWKTNDSDTVCL